MSSFHGPLFNRRFLSQRALLQLTPPEHKERLCDWADTIRGGSLRKQKESCKV